MLDLSNLRIKTYTFDRTIPLSEIKIPKEFKAHPPSEEKVTDCLEFYLRTGRFDRSIILNPNGYLADGYCAYLAAKAMRMKEIKAVQIKVKLRETVPSEPIQPEPPKPTYNPRWMLIKKFRRKSK